MKILLGKKFVDVKTVENLYNGLAEYIKRLPELVIVDMVDNNDETTKVIEEIKRVASRCNIKTSIVVLSSANTPKDNWACKYIEKVGNWHEKIDHELKEAMPIAS